MSNPTQTPIYDRLVLDRAGEEARAYVRAHLRLIACPTCHAATGEPCVTIGGQTRRLHHKARRIQ